MLTCLVKGTQQRVTYEQLEESGMAFNVGDLVCPVTGVKVLPRRPAVLKGGGKRRGHFFVKDRAPVAENIIFDPEYFEREGDNIYLLPRGESSLHIAGKQYISGFFEDEYPYHVQAVDFEVLVRLPDNRIRIADVLATLKDGSQVVGECQISPIQEQDLESRTRDYERAGLDVLWFFGPNAQSVSNELWSRDRFGEYLTLSFENV